MLVYLKGCQLSAHSSFSRASLLVSVSHPGRNHFQQREEMEGDPALLPHDPAEFRDGEKEHRGPRSRGSALPGGGVEKNERWVILCSVILTSADRSLLQGCPWKHFRGGHIFHMVHGFQPSHGEERERERRAQRAFVYLCLLCVYTQDGAYSVDFLKVIESYSVLKFLFSDH